MSLFQPFLIAGALLIGQTAAAERPVTVVVLDALSGKPEPGAKISYFCTGLPRNTPEKQVLTDSVGAAHFAYDCDDHHKLELWASTPAGRKEKDECGGGKTLSYEEISSTGYIQDPRAATGLGDIWCPDKISKKMKSQPGTIVIFMKKPTWYQSHVAG